MSNVVSLPESATQLKDSGRTLHKSTEYAANPHKAIMDFAAPFLDLAHIGPAKILVATYRQRIKTVGGVMLTEGYTKEDLFQGITGLVLKVGPMAFTDDARVKFGGFSAKAGEWVVYKPENGRATELRGLHCRIIEDVHIDMKCDDPELLW